jgi:hypothetical protein
MRWATARTTFCALALGLLAIQAYFSARADDSPTRVPLPADGIISAARPITVDLPACDVTEACFVTVSLAAPQKLGARDALPVRIIEAGSTVSQKLLHDGDPDWFFVRRTVGDRLTQLAIGGTEGAAAAFRAEVRVEAIARRAGAAPSPAASEVVVETEPNDRPEDAVEFALGQSIVASADDRPYIAALGSDEEEAKASGVDWYRFTAPGPEPRLAFITLDYVDREVPVDLEILEMKSGKPELYQSDFEKFEPEKTTRFAGMFKFVARRVQPGATYYLRVRGNHPAYQIHSETYPLPPYEAADAPGTREAAQQAVRTAMDYLLLKGDSWHANTPRVGGIDNRVHNVHAETAQCIACHPTHFTTRAAVFANDNGYPIRQRPSLQFLSERLYNNPRPFYGHPQAAWARMISASANVLSRLSIMLNLFEHNVAGFERTDVHRAVAEYLKLYYKSRTEIPANETNGNLPLVSKFEVAEYSWMVFHEMERRTGDASYGQWADQVRHLIESAVPEKHIQDMSDLCFQTSALCRIDRVAYAARIRDNVQRIYGYQQPNGAWPMRFGETELPADFQTGHCLYTLAFARESAADPRVDKAVRYLLARQQPFGAWFDHDDPKQSNPYENFRTPFYETQFAVMALSQLYPARDRDAARGKTGWGTGFDPIPQSLDSDNWRVLMWQLNSIWECSNPSLVAQVVGALKSENTLVRECAARCLGRVGDEGAVTPLVEALGDRSKLVRRSAAFALRNLGNRGLGKTAVTAALASGDADVRRGAMQVFAQHFRYWIDSAEARRCIITDRMADEDPYVRMMACRTLWQWWQWDADESVRGGIEDVFLACMAVEEHPWVRINLIEGFSNVCDENTRYLYNNWVALLGTKEDRDTATAGHHASGTRQAAKISQALNAGEARQTEAILQAIGYFHLRTGTYAAKGRFGRIGNDVEAIQFYSEAAPALRASLRPLVESDDPAIRGPALLAAYTLRGTNSEDAFGLPFLKALMDSDEFARGVASEFHSSFPPVISEATESSVAQTIASLLASKFPEARRAALEQIGKLKLSARAKGELAGPVRDCLADADDPMFPDALQAVAGISAMWKDPVVLKRVADAIQSKKKEVRQAAVRLALRSDAIGGVTIVRTRLDAAFGSSDAATRRSLLEMIQANEALLKHPRVAQLVSDGMSDDQESTRQLALDLVRRSRDLQSNAAVRAALAERLKDPNERTRQIAESLYSGKQLPRDDIDVTRLLDFEFFKQKVQPVFFAAGPDGKACVQCHHNHGILKLATPADDAPMTDALSRENYRAALRVVNLAEPEKSLILQKPMGSADTEGVVGASSVPHGGELRWPARQESADYQAILSWINGARVESAEPAKD